MSDIIATVLRASSHRFIGRLGSDPTIKYLDGGRAVASGRIAINKPGQKQGDGQEPDWFTVEVWSQNGAEEFADQFRKGDRVDVMGRVRTNRWTTRDGEQRLDLIVTVEFWRRMESQPAAPADAPAPAPAPAAPAAAPPPAYQPPAQGMTQAPAQHAAQRPAPAQPAATLYRPPVQGPAPGESFDDPPF